MIRFNILNTEEGTSVVTFIGSDGVPRTVTDESNFYTDVMKALINDEDPTSIYDNATVDLVSDERVEYDNGQFRFSGEAVPEQIGEVILRYQNEGRDTLNLAKFMERLLNNPSGRSREMLFTWTQSKEMVIDAEGYIIGYKGVTNDMLSVHSGTAYVNGTEHVGQIPNIVGTVITMPREKVQADPNQGCSYGLHVGNFSYASSFGAVVLEVRIDPADVVSVPKDCSYQKLRCCRYAVVAVHTSGKDDVRETYEPEATVDPESIEADLDGFMDAVPETFLAALRNRIASRFNRKNKDET